MPRKIPVSRKKSFEPRECEYCHEIFHPKHSRQRCCCLDHQYQMEREQRLDLSRANLIQNTGCLGRMGDPYADGRLRSDPLFCPVL